MNRKLLVQMTVCVAFFIIILTFNEKEALVANQSDLNKMIDVIQKSDGSVSEWSFFAREELEPSLTTNDLEKLKEQWEKKFPQFKWEKTLEDGHWQLIGTSNNEEQQYREKLQVVANLNENNLQGFVLYELKGYRWNNAMGNIVDEKSDQFFPQIFQKTPMKFSCIKGDFGDKMNIAVMEKSKQLNKEFNGKIVEKLAEQNFVSLTINSPYFKNQLPTEQGSFNMQISLRSDDRNEKTTFVIGTPILTIEY
ncbi:YwmB family TATA-box binding protein [Caldibacillus lycopersici]|uniref:YwmB family TATA-box binding protein n=1 Tax=Perspicuibacillus lycopersici TaxID=1325689 RepID=A0AAE3ITF4_9BACI|nr:YwmB family TATA-box binding protein [Perspicuibacillus lycopersici]MCU9613293.1 YwmB family TATA-box binding protein [Perspicuibacillus lycopersici]